MPGLGGAKMADIALLIGFLFVSASAFSVTVTTIGPHNRKRRFGITSLTASAMWLVVVFGLKVAGHPVSENLTGGSLTVFLALVAITVWNLSKDERKAYIARENGLDRLSGEALADVHERRTSD